MKTRTSLILCALAVLALVAVQSAQAATYYWDVTSPIEAAGFGTAGGTWGTDAFWTTSTTGLTTPGTAATATTDTINFGSTTDGLVAGIISVGTVSAGNITFASGSGAIELSGGTITLAAAETITVNNASDTIGSTLAGAGTSLTKLGAGTLTLSGSTANTYTGLTTVNAGTLLLNKSGAVNAIVNGGLTIGSASATAATVQYTGASTNMIGTGAVTINGAGQLDFNGKTDTIGNVSIVATGATAGTTPIINTAGLGNLTIGSLAMTPVAGYTSRINTGTGTLTLGGDVTFTAATTGQAQISGNLALGANRQFTINAGTGANYDMLIDAAISGTGFKLTKAGAGVLTLSGANTFTGGITIGSTASAGGTIRCDAANVLPDFSITMLGGTLNLNGNSDTIGIGGANYVLTFGAQDQLLSAGRTSTITTGVGTLTLNGNIYIDSNAKQQMFIEGKLDLGSATRTIQNHTYGGVGTGNEKVPLTIRAVISGTGVGVNLIKGNDGGATVGAIFSGANSYTGTTTINNSTLQLGEGGLTGSLSTSSTITLSNNGTLIFNRSNTITQGTDFNSVIGGSGTVQQKGSGTLILNGANTYNGVTTVNAGKLELAATGTTQTIAGGGLTINSGAWAQYTGNSTDMMGTGTVTVNGTGQFDFNGKTDTIGGITIVATGATAGTTPVINTAGGGNLTANGLNFTPVAGYTSQINTSTGTLTLGSDVTFNAATTGQAQISGNLALGTATRTFTIALGTGTNYDMLVDAIISSGAGGGLSKAGAGRLALSADNTYLGATAVSAGTLILSGNNASATGDIGVTGGAVQFDTTNSINGGAYNVLNRDVTVTSPGAVVFGSSFGAGNIPTALANRIVASSTGAIAPNNYAATNFDFNAAGLTAATLGAVGNVTYTGTLTPNGTTYRLGGGGGTLTMSNTNAVTGVGKSLVITGTGSTVILAGANDYDSGTTLTSGTLAVGNNNALGSGTLTFNGGGLSSDSTTARSISNAVTFTGNATLGNATNTGKLTFSNTAALGGATRTLTLNSDAQFDGIISSTGAFGITKAGTGILTLTQANTYTGPTTVNVGVLTVSSLANGGSNSVIGASSSAATNLVLGGGTLQYTGANASIDRAFTITAGTTGTFDITQGGTTLTLPGATGAATTGALTKTGLGGLTLSGLQTYTGTTTVSQGTLTLGAGNHTLAVNKTLTVNGGTLDLGAYSQYVGNFTGTGGIVTGSGLFTTNAANGTYAGSIQGSLNFVKAGANTLILTADNTTSGTVKVIGGGVTLKDSGVLSNATGAITVNGATLTLDNTGTANNNDRVNNSKAITLNSGRIDLNGRASTNSAETLGAVTADSGSLIFYAPIGTSGSAQLTMTSLARTTGATIFFNQGMTNFGTAGNSSRVLANTTNTQLTGNLAPINSVVPGAFYMGGTDNYYFVDYSTTLGFKQLGTTTNNFITAGATDNVSDPTQNPCVVGAAKTINSFKQGNITFTNGTSTGGTDLLTFASGMTILTNNTWGSTTQRGRITSGTNELFLFKRDGNTTPDPVVNSVIVDKNGSTAVDPGDKVSLIIHSQRQDRGYYVHLTAPNLYSGGTFVDVGPLNVTAAGLSLDATSSGIVTLPAGGLTINNKSLVEMTGFQGQIDPTNVVTINGGGQLHLMGTNTLAGIVFNSNGGTVVPTVTPYITITAGSSNALATYGAKTGTLKLAATGYITSTPTNVAVTPLIDSGTLDLNGTATHDITVAALPEGNFVNTLTPLNGLQISSVITNGGFTKKGAGVLNLTGNNTFTGNLTVQEGVLNVATFNEVSAAGPLGKSTNPVVLGGTGSLTGALEYTGGNVTSTRLFTMATGGTGAFQVDTAATVLTLSGLIDGSGGLAKTGAGGLTLSGAKTYTGATTVTDGILKVTGSLANSDITVQGGKFTGGSGTITFNLGLSPDLITMTGGTLDISTLTIDFAGTAVSSYVLVDYSVGGMLVTAINSATANTFFAATNVPADYEFEHDTVNKRILLTPEPATLALLGLGGLGLLLSRKRR